MLLLDNKTTYTIWETIWPEGQYCSGEWPQYNIFLAILYN